MMELSYNHQAFRVSVTGIETIVFGIMLGLWHTPIPIMQNDAISEPFKHLSDVPEVIFIVIVGIVATSVSLLYHYLGYRIQLASLILMQLIWSYSLVGLGIGFLDQLQDPNTIQVAPWALFLSFSIFIQNCGNIYTLAVLERARREQLDQLVQLKSIESKIAVTRQTTTQQLAKLKEVRDNQQVKKSKAGIKTGNNHNS